MDASTDPEWEKFEQEGHTFVRSGFGEHEWTCSACGATKNDHIYTGLPDDSFAVLLVDGTEQCVDSCAEAVALRVLDE